MGEIFRGLELQKEQFESEQERNSRRANGDVTNEEILDYWKNPEQPFFEHELVTTTKTGKEIQTKFTLSGLNEKNLGPLLEETRNSWSEADFEDYKYTLELFVESRKSRMNTDYSNEFYVISDENGHPYAVAGIYSEDYKGTRGLKTSNRLDSSNHNYIVGGDWGALSTKREYKGTGMGSRFLFPWIGKMAKARGANLMLVHCDDSPNENYARNIYVKNGFQEGSDVKDYFGPGRDLHYYYCNLSSFEKTNQEQFEEVNRENLAEIMKLGNTIYSPERQEELKLSLDLLVEKYENIKDIHPDLREIVPKSIIIRNDKGGVESFAVILHTVYGNVVEIIWAGAEKGNIEAKKKILDAIKSHTKENGREVIMFGTEGKDEELTSLGFHTAKDGIPETTVKGDPAKLLIYSKKL